jgi:hypothetical protein
MHRLRSQLIVLFLSLAAVSLFAASAQAANWYAGADPSANFTVTFTPACDSDPASAQCLSDGIAALNNARASLGQPAYALPSDFTSLDSNEQMFVLANLDRLLYGLPAITGINIPLSADATAGITADTDPVPSATNYAMWTANWAGAFPDSVWAYLAWMYDDGPGSSNLDCSPSTPGGCWGHRNDVLAIFGLDEGPTAMGVATGVDSSGAPGYAMLLFQGDQTYTTSYTYSWQNAIEAGANGGVYGPTLATETPSTPTPSAPAATTITPKTPKTPRTEHMQPRVYLSVHGHRVTITISLFTGSGSASVSVARGSQSVALTGESDRHGLVTFRTKLDRGHWRVRVSYHPAAGYRAATATEQLIRIS